MLQPSSHPISFGTASSYMTTTQSYLAAEPLDTCKLKSCLHLLHSHHLERTSPGHPSTLLVARTTRLLANSRMLEYIAARNKSILLQRAVSMDIQVRVHARLEHPHNNPQPLQARRQVKRQAKTMGNQLTLTTHHLRHSLLDDCVPGQLLGCHITVHCSKQAQTHWPRGLLGSHLQLGWCAYV
jgi:hypothetical protein